MVYHYFVLLKEIEKSPNSFDQHSFVKHSITTVRNFFIALLRILSPIQMFVTLTQATRRNNPL